MVTKKLEKKHLRVVKGNRLRGYIFICGYFEAVFFIATHFTLTKKKRVSLLRQFVVFWLGFCRIDSVFPKTRSKGTILQIEVHRFAILDFFLKEPVCEKEFWNCILMFCITIQLLDSNLVLRWAICAKSINK